MFCFFLVYMKIHQDMYTTHCDDFYLNKNSCSSRSNQEKKRCNRSEQTWFTRFSLYFSMHVKGSSPDILFIDWVNCKFYLTVEQTKCPIVSTKSNRLTRILLHIVKYPPEDCRRKPRYSFHNHVYHNKIQQMHWLTFLNEEKENRNFNSIDLIDPFSLFVFRTRFSPMTLRNSMILTYILRGIHRLACHSFFLHRYASVFSSETSDHWVEDIWTGD